MSFVVEQSVAPPSVFIQVVVDSASASDEVDANNPGALYETVVFDTHGVERGPWAICGHSLAR